MEQQSLQHHASQPSLYEDVRISFTPSFFSNGWECMLTPIHEYDNTHLDTPGSIRIDLQWLKQLLLKVHGWAKGWEAGSWTTTIVKLFF